MLRRPLVELRNREHALRRQVARHVDLLRRVQPMQLAEASLVVTLWAAATGGSFGGRTVNASKSVSDSAPPAPLWPRSSLSIVSVSGPV
jgi:hypothetical protein